MHPLERQSSTRAHYLEPDDLDRKMTPEEQKEYLELPTNFILPLRDTPTKPTGRLSKIFDTISELTANFPFERTHPVSMTNTQTNLVSNNYEKKILRSLLQLTK